MGRNRQKWQLIAGFTLATCMGLAGFSHAQFTPFSDHRRALLEGNWQSCREGDGQYSERVYDGRWAGFEPFELHLGPYHEFAVYRGIQEAHRDHNSPENLLKPFDVEIRANAARHSWDVAGMHLEVALSGGSREQCESWYVNPRTEGDNDALAARQAAWTDCQVPGGRADVASAVGSPPAATSTFRTRSRLSCRGVRAPVEQRNRFKGL